jgi:hypothetical protein
MVGGTNGAIHSMSFKGLTTKRQSLWPFSTAFSMYAWRAFGTKIVVVTRATFGPILELSFQSFKGRTVMTSLCEQIQPKEETETGNWKACFKQPAAR